MFFGCGNKKGVGEEETPKWKEIYVFLKFTLGITPHFEQTLYDLAALRLQTVGTSCIIKPPSNNTNVAVYKI